MTKIAIVPNAAGTGTFTIEAPNSNSNRTLVLPDAAGELLTTTGDGSALTNLPAPTTAQVLDATASASVGSVGTYAFLWHTGAHVEGTTIAGSDLEYAGQNGSSTRRGTVVGSGTWRAMGSNINNAFGGATVWLRIS
jgi:hypothetical protein